MNKPDWKQWINLAEVELWQATALSCDVDPNAPQNFNEALSEIDHRLRIAESHVRQGNLFARKLSIPTAGLIINYRDMPSMRHALVSLTGFRAWGEQLLDPFTFPDEFPKTVPREKQLPHALANTEKPFRADTRKNWLRIIRALYEKVNLPEREAVGTIEQMIHLLGFDGPRNDTIRQVLDEARALEPDRKS